MCRKQYHLIKITNNNIDCTWNGVDIKFRHCFETIFEKNIEKIYLHVAQNNKGIRK